MALFTTGINECLAYAPLEEDRTKLSSFQISTQTIEIRQKTYLCSLKKYSK